MLVFFLILAGVLLILELRSLQIPKDFVEYESLVSKKEVEQGETFTLTSIYTNKTGKRVPFVRSEEFLDADIEIDGEERLKKVASRDSAEDIREHKKTYSIYLRKNERVTHSVEAKCYTRGVHAASQCHLAVGDFLGITEKMSERPINTWIAVYPRKINDARIERVVKGVMGDISVRSFVHEDPILIRSYRDYTASDPFRSISFTQSAKSGKMVSKEFDHTREITVDIVFDAGFKGNIDGYFTRIEACFSVARAICEQLSAEKIGFRFITNLCCTEYSNSDIVTIEADYSRLLHFLTVSSKATVCKHSDFLKLLEKNYARTDASIIYIAQEPNQETVDGLALLETKYGIRSHTLWGMDFEEVYNDSKVL